MPTSWASVSFCPAPRAARQASLFAGVNAGVVGIVLAAWYRPVWTSTVLKASDFALVLAGYMALTVWKAPPWAVVVAIAAVAGLSTFFT
jgi:chromate transporter